jgi:hypothetical protein
MYQRVLEDNLEFPDGVMSNEARHFIFQVRTQRMILFNYSHSCFREDPRIDWDTGQMGQT